MKLKMKLMAAAVAMAAASGANAAIDTGLTGNGELFVNLTNAASSYTRDLNLSIDSFTSAISASGAINLSWTADSLLTSWLQTVTGPIEMNIYAVDGGGQRRIVSTFASDTLTPKPADTLRAAVTDTQTKLNGINPSLTGGAGIVGTVDSAVFAAGTAGYTGTNAFNDTINNKLGFDASSTAMYDVLNMRTVFANASGTTNGTYTTLVDTTLTAGPLVSSNVQAYFTANNTLHVAAIDNVAAIPEPSEYALMLAGLGMLGFMARRRLNNRA